MTVLLSFAASTALSMMWLTYALGRYVACHKIIARSIARQDAEDFVDVAVMFLNTLLTALAITLSFAAFTATMHMYGISVAVGSLVLVLPGALINGVRDTVKLNRRKVLMRSIEQRFNAPDATATS